MNDGWRVHKFGGSSVADATCMRRVADILDGENGSRLAVVLSASRGVTDALLNLVTSAERQQDFAPSIEALRLRHREMASALLPAPDANEYAVEFDRDCTDIFSILQAVRLTRSAATTIRDLVAGFGEIWSTRLFARYLRGRLGATRNVVWVDAREIVEIEWAALGPIVHWERSRNNAAGLRAIDKDTTLIITGFIARKSDGLQTTLGRNGSDFSASIFGALLDATEISIWTDVDGVLSADPRRVPEATVIDSLSYNEAMELAYFGAKVIHPQTMAPAVQQQIPIRIRNTFAPEKPGTSILGVSASHPVVKGITSIESIALINVEGAGMIGVPGTAQRLFGALRECGISVILISQGSSEHSICFAISEADAERTERAVRDAFDPELRLGQIQNVEVQRGACILSVVGDGMAGTPGIAARVFLSLADVGVNVRAIAQGSSERNISVVIDQKHTAKALRSVHAGFYLSPHTISIGLIGPGVVGSALLDQLASQAERLRHDFRLDLRLRGIATSKQMTLSDLQIPLDSWRDARSLGIPTDLTAFEEHIHADHLPHAVIIDCSASATVADFYPKWLAAGIHLVTPNKKANSGSLDLYSKIREARKAGGSHYLYEATVGAGLPIIQTLRDLRETGDAIRLLEGILSGTLAYLFNVWDGRRPFSAIVREAKANGYTEPDPRDDLSGMDVARKLIILAREMGLPLELRDVDLKGLIPPALAECSPEAFMDRLSELDEPMGIRLARTLEKGLVLRYVGILDAASRRATVGLVEMERSHPFANINLTDNVVRYVTSRYDKNPLVIQGPGAGPAVTAAGVFSDLLRVCAYLGAKL
jgi:aspartokinase/homoserine dehydrogenase 1